MMTMRRRLGMWSSWTVTSLLSADADACPALLNGNLPQAARKYKTREIRRCKKGNLQDLSYTFLVFKILQESSYTYPPSPVNRKPPNLVEPLGF